MVSRRSFAVSVVCVLVMVAAVAGCGGDDDGTAVTTTTRQASPAERGRSLAQVRGCLSCHSTDGSAGVGPTFEGLAGSTVQLADGREVAADRDYLERSIAEPDADIVEGYSAGVMAEAIRPDTLGQDEVDALVAYLETLR